MKRYFTLLLLIAIVNTLQAQVRQFRNNLYIVDPNGNAVLMDGTLNMFHDDYSNDVNNQDARKMSNPGENLGMLREGKTLIVERRKDVSTPDTVFYKLWNTRIITYRLQLMSKNFENSDVSAVLYDHYLGTQMDLSLTETNYYDFSVTADAGSKRPDRFTVVFRPIIGASPMPLSFVNATATANAGRVHLTWETADEKNVKNYRIERSADGAAFASIGNDITARNEVSNKYNALDISPAAGANFYRIVATDVDGKKTYSKTVKASVNAEIAKLLVYPNPANPANIHLHISGHAAGQYKLSIINGFGSVVHSQTENLSSHTERIRLSPANSLPGGVYTIEVKGPAGYRATHNLIVKP